jgi:hypothetical protein
MYSESTVSIACWIGVLICWMEAAMPPNWLATAAMVRA